MARNVGQASGEPIARIGTPQAPVVAGRLGDDRAWRLGVSGFDTYPGTRISIQ